MTNSVTVNGNTYNDGNVGPNNMGLGGFRSYLFPMLSDTVIQLGLSTTAAAASATSAAASASSAVNAPGTNGTSTTSLTIGTGSQSFTTQTGKNFTVGQFVSIAFTTNANNYMFGNITSYNSGTGAMVVNVTQTAGSGTLAGWSIGLSGPSSLTGVTNEVNAGSVASAGTVFVDSLTGNFFTMTGNASVSGFNISNGRYREFQCTGTPTFIHNTSFISVPGGVNYTASVGDVIRIRAIAANQVVITDIISVTGRTTGLSGAITATGSTTLTASSAACQTIAPSAFGQYLTLPDATTCPLGALIFTIFNIGDFPLGIKNNSGTQLGWISPHKSVIIGLADHATAAGVWAIPDVAKVSVTASLLNSTLNLSGTVVQQRIALDANRTMFLFASTSAAGALTAVVYDQSSQTWGATVQVAAAATAFGAVFSATNQVLVSYVNASTTLTALTLTTSGTTITANATATVTVGGIPTANKLFPMIAAGSSFVVGFNRATTSDGIVAMTITGTTVALGAESIVNTTIGGIQIVLFASGSTLLVFTPTTTPTVKVTPYVVTSTSLALGTAATATSVGTNSLRCGAIGSNWFLTYNGTAGLVASIVTLSGTTVTFSNATVSTSLTATTLASYDVSVVSATKLAVIGSVSTGTVRSNLITNSSGTASAGTEQVTTVVASLADQVKGSGIIGLNGNIVEYLAVGATSTSTLLKVDATSSSLVVTPLDTITAPSYAAVGGPGTSNGDLTRSGNNLNNSNTWYSAANIGTGLNLCGNTNQITMANFTLTSDLGLDINLSANVIAGANTNESWNNSPLSTAGFQLQRVECVA